jgi:hypothetical protein
MGSVQVRFLILLEAIHLIPFPPVDQLYSVYQTAERLMSQRPYPELERLAPQLQVGHQMYQSIPEKVAKAGDAKAKSRFGGWF